MAKNLPITTRDYLEKGFSVYWATPADFSNSEFDFSVVETAFEAHSSFAYTPDQSAHVGAYSKTDLEWDDPFPECDHEWRRAKDRIKVCARCRINKLYTETGRYRYDPFGFLGKFDESEVPKLPAKSSQPTTDVNQNTGSANPTADSNGFTQRKYRGIPECSDPRGHRWRDYDWADRGKASCEFCSAKIKKHKLDDYEILPSH